jgi:phosphoribosylaminoimidazolecarboxamide formyltransferase / IMP cyclohydrolase
MPLRRALLSVSDKTGLVDFARALHGRGVVLLSTGGTYKALHDAGIPVVAVDQYTESPEVMDGRVKTLHPRIHGGLLAREKHDEADLQRLGAGFIDLVVVNLYPFEQTLKRSSATYEELVENIDIGGPSMLRSAAKNHARVTVICDTADYATVLSEVSASGGEVSAATKRRLAAKVFAHTAAYDGMIAEWLSAQVESLDSETKTTTPIEFAPTKVMVFERRYPLRYGENPHQSGAFYAERGAPKGSLALSESLGSGAKELSFNNLVDVEAAIEAVRDFEGPAAVVIKHASPCGLATANSLNEAYFAAREADAMSAFGGIVALNRQVDAETARTVAETFIECVIAPSFSPAALDVLRAKSALRILATGEWLPSNYQALQYKRVGGGIVVQDRDATGPGEVRQGKVVTKRAPTSSELAALEFGWAACKHVRSNAIVLSKTLANGALATVGIGGGQTARVLAVRIACETAKNNAVGSVLASDAFFPFPDGLEAAAQAGITAIAQPGGSKQDPAVIEAADRANVAMVFTGVRHFRH